MASDSSRSVRGDGEPTAVSDEQLHRAIEQIRAALQSLRFGQVTVTVQDGVIVQIDRTEKMRLR